MMYTFNRFIDYLSGGLRDTRSCAHCRLVAVGVASYFGTRIVLSAIIASGRFE